MNTPETTNITTQAENPPPVDRFTQFKIVREKIQLIDEIAKHEAAGALTSEQWAEMNRAQDYVAAFLWQNRHELIATWFMSTREYVPLLQALGTAMARHNVIINSMAAEQAAKGAK